MKRSSDIVKVLERYTNMLFLHTTSVAIVRTRLEYAADKYYKEVRV